LCQKTDQATKIDVIVEQNVDKFKGMFEAQHVAGDAVDVASKPADVAVRRSGRLLNSDLVSKL
jgi:hypothetical protein